MQETSAASPNVILFTDLSKKSFAEYIVPECVYKQRLFIHASGTGRFFE